MDTSPDKSKDSVQEQEQNEVYLVPILFY